MKHLYLVLAVVGAIVPNLAFVPWLADNGLNLPLLLREMFATRVAAFFSLDVIVSALVVFALAAHGRRRGVPYAGLAILGTCAVGVSLGLPLYLHLEAKHRPKPASGPSSPEAASLA